MARSDLSEPSTVTLSEVGHRELRRLKEMGVFADMVDAYRFAIAFAISQGAISESLGVQSSTIFNVGTLDGDEEIYNAVAALREAGATEPVYKTVERLADWGVREMARRMDDHTLDLAELLRQAERQ